MFALQFISNEVFPLKKSDTAESALMFLSDWMLRELPVVEGGKVIGYVNEKMLLDREQDRVELCMNTQTDLLKVHEHTHLFDVYAALDKGGLSSLVVLNSDEQFVGILHGKDMLNLAFSHSALNQEGSIVVLEITAIQYSLAEISRICESNDAKIIHLLIETMKDEDNSLHVSLKLNRLYLTHVIASLERFGYKVVYTNSPLDPNHSLDDRFNWLVKYLNT